MLVLGSVDVVRDDKNGVRWSKLVPLYEVEEDGNLRPVVASSEFPPDGKIFWPAAEAVTVGDYLFCRVVPNDGGAKENRKDAFKVQSATQAHEVLDLRSSGSPEQVRVAMMNGAVPLGRPLFALCAPDLAVGPLRFKRSGASATLELDVTHPEKLEVRQLTTADYYRLPNNKQMMRTDDGVFRGRLQGYVDWDKPDLVVKRALKLAVDSARSGQATPEERAQLELLSKHTRAALVDRNTVGSSSDVALEVYRLKRAEEFLLSALAKDARVGDEVVSILQSHPKVETELERVRVAAAAEARVVALKSFEPERAVQMKELAAIQAEKEAQRRELGEVNARLEAARAEAAVVEEEVSKRVRAALASPAALLADVSLLRAAGLSGGAGSVPPPVAPHGPALRWSSSAHLEGDLVVRLQGELRAVGVKSLVAQRLVGAFAAKMMPILLGPVGFEALDAFARLVCGGRLITVPVGPGFMDPGDLLGHRTNGELVPRAGALLEAAQRADEFSGPSLVVFEGINRAPTETYLLPLLRRRGLLAPMATQVPMRGGAEFIVPDRLLFAATAVAGPTTLPMSGDLWDSAVAIEVDRLAPSGLRSGLSEVAIDRLHKTGAANAQVVDEVLAEFPGVAVLQSSLERYATGLAGVKEKEQVRAALFEGLVAPWLMSFGLDERLALIEEGHASKEQLAVLSRIRRRLG